MVGICCAWKVLFSIWCDEELVLAPVVLNCYCEHFPVHSLMCVGFSLLLLLQWFAYCSSREVSFCWSIYSIQNEFSKDTFVSWCSWRSWFYRNGSVTWMFFLCGSLFSCYVFHDYTKPEKMKSIYMFFSADSFLKQSLADLLQMRCGQAVTWNMIETAGLTVVTPMILEVCQTSLETAVDMFL